MIAAPILTLYLAFALLNGVAFAKTPETLPELAKVPTLLCWRHHKEALAGVLMFRPG